MTTSWIRKGRRWPGGATLLAFSVMVVLQHIPVRAVLAQQGNAVSDVTFHFTAGKYAEAIAAAEAAIAESSSDREIAVLLGFKGRSLLHLQRAEGDVFRAFKDAHGHDPSFAPDATWTPEEREAYADAIKSKGKWWLYPAVGAAAVVAIVLAVGAGGEDSDSDILPGPPPPPSVSR